VRGAQALHTVASDVVRHLNLLLLLRLVCELTATTLVALVAVDTFGAVDWRPALVTAGAMTVVSFVVVGVGPRTIGRQHAYAVGRYAAPLVRWLGRALGPLASLLILIGNLVTPGRGFREGVRHPGRAARAGRPGRAAGRWSTVSGR
jgi:CBS domain containing-hemolysin-like protein